jgi:hypothetical protein
MHLRKGVFKVFLSEACQIRFHAQRTARIKKPPIVMPGVSLPHLGVHLLGKNPQTELNTNARPREHVHAYAIPARHWDLGTLVGDGHVGRSGIRSTLIQNSYELCPIANLRVSLDETSAACEESIEVGHQRIGEEKHGLPLESLTGAKPINQESGRKKFANFAGVCCDRSSQGSGENRRPHRSQFSLSGYERKGFRFRSPNGCRRFRAGSWKAHRGRLRQSRK